jgi:hypothetical protein
MATIPPESRLGNVEVGHYRESFLSLSTTAALTNMPDQYGGHLSFPLGITWGRFLSLSQYRFLDNVAAILDSIATLVKKLWSVDLLQPVGGMT